MDRAMTGTLSQDLARWRSDTPGCTGLVHLNNAGAALVPRPVRDAILAHLALEEKLGGYEAADAQVEQIRRAYADVARLLGANPRNVALVQNSTVAFAQAINAFDLAPGDVILTSRSDYASNQIMYLSLARRRGVEVVGRLPCDYMAATQEVPAGTPRTRLPSTCPIERSTPAPIRS